MWFRYHNDLGREPFPDFENKHSWRSAKLFVNSRANSTEERSNSLTLNTEYKHIKSELEAAGIKSTKVTHIFRRWSNIYLEIESQGRLGAKETWR